VSSGLLDRSNRILTPPRNRCPPTPQVIAKDRECRPSEHRLLDSRQPSSTEVRMRVIGLVLALTLTLLPLAAWAQPAERIYRIGVLGTNSDFAID
jgi:hypothetical protein